MKWTMDDVSLPIEVAGLTFRNPFYVGSGPTSKSIEHLVKADQCGWAGASIKLTFDPAPYVSLEPRYGWFDDMGFLSFSAESRLTNEEGLQLIKDGRRECRDDFLLMANITYIGDKPGVQGWVDMAKRFQDAGSHIIELNMCCPNMSYNVRLSGKQDTAHQTGASLGQNPEALGHIVSEVRKALDIPLFIKLTPEGGRIAQVAQACFEAGADAVGGTANRLGVPPVDIDDPIKSPYQLQKEPSMSCMCGPWLGPLARRDIYETRKLVGPEPVITAAGGIMELRDVVGAAACGGDLMCICTGILLKGFEMLPPLVKEVKKYLADKELDSLRAMRDGLVKTITPATKLTVTRGVARKKNDFLRGPCQAACPFQVPAQDYITSVADGDSEQAFRMVSTANPLQSICGWVCSHPCEEECTRAEIDESIRIRDIKRYILERGATEGWQPEIRKADADREKVAVIGAGPAGLSSAWHLARAGYKVTVFESEDKAGGALTYAIPSFRLPAGVLESELKLFANMGVDIQTGKALGRDVTLEGLKSDGYAATVLALGTTAGLPLGIPGEDGAGCTTAVEFLRDVARGDDVNVGKRVAVIGGGFTAIDSARTALRMGAEEVYILYRRTRPEMPATTEEVDDAEAEGVKVMYLVSPKAVVREGDDVKAIHMVNHVLGAMDTGGRRRPEEVLGTEFMLQVDTVITAVSQGLAQGEDALGVKVDGNTIASSDGVATSVDGVFVAGDAATGPDTVIAAVAGGYNAAVAVDARLAGDDAFLEALPALTPADKELILARNNEEVKRKRVAANRREADVRVKDFETYEEVMSEAEAIAEATRCLKCGCSETCGICKKICSSFAIDQDESGQHCIDDEKCHACGMCVQLCPNDNIELVKLPTEA